LAITRFSDRAFKSKNVYAGTIITIMMGTLQVADFTALGERFMSNLVDYAPGVIGAVLIILVGYFISRFICRIVSKLLEKAGFEKLCERIKLTDAFKRLGFKSVSSLIGTLVFWALFIMFIGWGFQFVNVPQLVPILAVISQLIVRVLAAFVIVIAGIAVAELIVHALKAFVARLSIGKYFEPVDKTIEKSGFKLFDFLYMAIRAFVILFFVEGAFQVLNVEFLSRVVEPVLLYIPKLIVAIAVVLVGVMVAEFVVRLVNKLLTAIYFSDLVKPVEKTIKREGIIARIIDIVIRIFVLIFFLEMALDMLGIPLLIEFLNTVLLWIPSLVVALAIVVLAWWFGSWLSEKASKWANENNIPFPNIINIGVKYAIIAIGVLIALDQIQIEVYLLNAILSIVAVALIIPIGVALSFGFRDYGTDFGVGLKLKRVAFPGDRVDSPEVEGEVVEIGNLVTTLKTKEGKVIISNSALRNARVVKKVK
jgi:Small-conductance mechanosensitive channel